MPTPMPATRSVRAILLATLLVVAAAALLAPGPASAAVTSFKNQTPIAVPGSGTVGPASPYPSPVAVSGMAGPITDVSVTLHGVSHAQPNQMRVLLISPHGTAVSLMDLVCGDEAVAGYTWIFNQRALAEMPRKGPCDGVAYRPSGYAYRLEWPPPRPPALLPTTDLGRLTGEDANGTWDLYVADAGGGNTGEIAGGWTLTVETYDGPIDMLVPGDEYGATNPYPATRAVAAQAGVIADVNVGIEGIWHQAPDDLDMLLVGPGGQKVVLTSDACGESGIEAVTWSFDDEAAAPLSDPGPCTSGSYRPADYAPDDYWPPGTPPGPYATSLSEFDGTDPNGQWQLFVRDDLPYEVGFITNRFTLSVATRPRATVAFAESAVALAEGATRPLVVRRSGSDALGAGAVTVTSSPRSAGSGSDFAPVKTTLQFAANEREKSIVLKALADDKVEPDETFAVALSDATGDAEATTAPAVVTIRDATKASAGAGHGAGRAGPVIGGVALAPARFAVAGRRAAHAGARGTTIRYSLSEPAAVTLRFQRAVSGRLAGAACRPLTAGNRKGRPCRRYVRAGTLRRAGRSGANRVAFSGRIGNRALRTGSYRLVVTAVDPAGNRSSSPPRAFRIVA
jgi:subtilisin-like proprotein convertase family protein